MDSRYLRYFIAVAEAKSFTHAAERLHTAQPSLSRQIKRLETIVGAPLFFRTKHNVRLTAAGEIFLRESRAILLQMERAITLAREGTRAEAGHITIGFVHGTEKIFFDNLFPRLRGKYFDMQITFRSYCEKDLFASLDDHIVDAAFLNGPYHDPQVVTELFVYQRIIAALPASHRLSKLKRVPIAQLAELPLVGPDPELWPIYYEVIQRLGRNANVRFAIADTKYDSAVTSLHAVATGAGFSLIPDCRIETFPHGVVACELALEPVPRMELLLAHRKDKVSPALSLFLDVFQGYLKDHAPV